MLVIFLITELFYHVKSDPAGYDGRKVDMWSAGIIYYSLFTTSLPFGSDLSSCARYKYVCHGNCLGLTLFTVTVSL